MSRLFVDNVIAGCSVLSQSGAIYFEVWDNEAWEMFSPEYDLKTVLIPTYVFNRQAKGLEHDRFLSRSEDETYDIARHFGRKVLALSQRSATSPLYLGVVGQIDSGKTNFSHGVVNIRNDFKWAHFSDIGTEQDSDFIAGLSAGLGRIIAADIFPGGWERHLQVGNLPHEGLREVAEERANKKKRCFEETQSMSGLIIAEHAQCDLEEEGGHGYDVLVFMNQLENSTHRHITIVVPHGSDLMAGFNKFREERSHDKVQGNIIKLTP